MKKYLFIIFSLIGSASPAFSQDKSPAADSVFQEPEPVLVEVMIGDKWGMLQDVILKKIKPESKFRFFNLTNYEKTYKENEPANYIIQSLVYYEFIKNFNVGLGTNLKAFGGFKPLLAAAYIYNSRNITLVAQPSVELHKDGVSELFVLFEYRGTKGRKAEPFFSLQGSNSYVEKNWDHDYTYINGRIGVECKNFRFGPAINFRLFGTARGQANYGAFLGVAIF